VNQLLIWLFVYLSCQLVHGSTLDHRFLETITAWSWSNSGFPVFSFCFLLLQWIVHVTARFLLSSVEISSRAVTKDSCLLYNASTFWILLSSLLTIQNLMNLHSLDVQNLFLVSEGLLFVSFFWTSFHSLSSPTLGTWPGEGFYLPDPCELTFANTLLLSNAAISLGNAFISLEISSQFFIYFSLFSFILAWTFIEFRIMGLSINDSVYSCLFFFLTGLHFFHLLVGLLLCCLLFWSCSCSNLWDAESELFPVPFILSSTWQLLRRE